MNCTSLCFVGIVFWVVLLATIQLQGFRCRHRLTPFYLWIPLGYIHEIISLRPTFPLYQWVYRGAQVASAGITVIALTCAMNTDIAGIGTNTWTWLINVVSVYAVLMIFATTHRRLSLRTLTWSCMFSHSHLSSLLVHPTAPTRGAVWSPRTALAYGMVGLISTWFRTAYPSIWGMRYPRYWHLRFCTFDGEFSVNTPVDAYAMLMSALLYAVGVIHVFMQRWGNLTGACTYVTIAILLGMDLPLGYMALGIVSELRKPHNVALR